MNTLPTSDRQSALRRELALASLVMVLAALVIGAAMAAILPTSGMYPVKVAGMPILLVALVAPHLADHPLPSLGPANWISLGRAVIAGVLAAFLGDPAAPQVAWLLVAGGAVWFGLDWVDGRVARATGYASPFGARLDMELDALTILAMSALVWQLDHAGPWVLASGLLRYVFVAAGWAGPYLRRPLFSTPRRAFVCGVQVTCLVGALAPWPVPGLSDAIALFGLVALVVSFGIDTAWLYAHRVDP